MIELVSCADTSVETHASMAIVPMTVRGICP